MPRPDRLITLGLVRPLQKLGLWPFKPGLPILMYHSISDRPELDVPAYYRVNTSPKRFAEQMAWLDSAGYVGVDLETGMKLLKQDQLQTAPQPLANPVTDTPSYMECGARTTDHGLPATVNGLGARRRFVAITFDDGFQDFYTEALPVLQKHGFSATMFLPTAFIGDQRLAFCPTGGKRLPGSGRPFCLTWSEVHQLRAAGIQIGSHTVNHARLYDLSWEQIKDELFRSKETIERELGESITTFAYPYAYPQALPRFVEPFESLLGATGYRHNVTTRIGRVSVGANRLALRRLPVNDADDIPLLRAKLEGAYDWLGGVQAAVKRVKRRLAERPTANRAQANMTAGLAPSRSPGTSAD